MTKTLIQCDDEAHAHKTAAACSVFDEGGEGWGVLKYKNVWYAGLVAGERWSYILKVDRQNFHRVMIYEIYRGGVKDRGRFDTDLPHEQIP